MPSDDDCSTCGSPLYVDGACPMCTCHRCDEHFDDCECGNFQNLADQYKESMR